MSNVSITYSNMRLNEYEIRSISFLKEKPPSFHQVV